MKAKEIRDLIDFISHSGLDEVNIETEEFKLSVKKNSWRADHTESQPAKNQVKSSYKVEANPSSVGNVERLSTEAETTEKYLTIRSPMIGTFYQSPNPESEAYVKVGDMVAKGQTVCIIEAMKLFNEIEAEISGRVVKILVENASPVEYDQPLFLVDPS